MTTRKRKNDPKWVTKLPKECPTCKGKLFYGQCAECMKHRPKDEHKPPTVTHLDFSHLASSTGKNGNKS